MASSRLRSRERRQLRGQAHTAIRDIPTKFLLEALATRLGIVDGKLEVKFRDGFVVNTTATPSFRSQRGPDDSWVISRQAELRASAEKEGKAPGGTE